MFRLLSLLAEDPNNRTKYDAMVLCLNGMGAHVPQLVRPQCGILEFFCASAHVDRAEKGL